jgi:hypothetical protein
MNYKYRLSKVKVFNWKSCECFGDIDIFEFSHYKYRIEKKGLFGWKVYLDNISDEEKGFKLLREVQENEKI